MGTKYQMGKNECWLPSFSYTWLVLPCFGCAFIPKTLCSTGIPHKKIVVNQSGFRGMMLVAICPEKAFPVGPVYLNTLLK